MVICMPVTRFLGRSLVCPPTQLVCSLLACFLSCLVGHLPALSLACLVIRLLGHSLAWSFACMVTRLLGRLFAWSSIDLLADDLPRRLVIRRLVEPPPLLKCALASQPEPRRMRAIICPRSGRSPKRCAPSGRRRSTAPDCPGTNNSSNMN